MDPPTREREVAALLDRWPWDEGGVIIGGYANAAFGFPRYSTDIDVVVKRDAFTAIDAWLLSEGFVRGDLPENLAENYAGKAFRYVRGDLTIDVLPGVVRDREAGVDLPERWISRNPQMTRLFLLDTSTQTQVPVCRLTAFWALKLQAGREKDLSDLFMTRGEPIDVAELQAVFRAIRKPSLDAKLRQVLARLDDPKVFQDVMARRGIRRHGGIHREAEWAKFKARVSAILTPLLET